MRLLINRSKTALWEMRAAFSAVSGGPPKDEHERPGWRMPDLLSFIAIYPSELLGVTEDVFGLASGVFKWRQHLFQVNPD